MPTAFACIFVAFYGNVIFMQFVARKCHFKLQICFCASHAISIVRGFKRWSSPHTRRLWLHQVESGFALNVLFNIFKVIIVQKASVTM